MQKSRELLREKDVYVKDACENSSDKVQVIVKMNIDTVGVE